MILAQLQPQPFPVQPPLAPPTQPGQAPSGPPPDIRDIVPPEPLPDYLQLFLIVLLAVLSTVMIGLFLYWYLRERRLEKTAAPPPVPPVERARRELEQLRKDVPGLSPNELSVRTSTIIKTYFHERYDDPVLFETSEEFLRRDNVMKPLPQSKRVALAEFLQRCDVLKYSRYPEAAAHAQPLIDEAFQIVDEPQNPAVKAPAPAPFASAASSTAAPPNG